VLLNVASSSVPQAACSTLRAVPRKVPAVIAVLPEVPTSREGITCSAAAANCLMPAVPIAAAAAAAGPLLWWLVLALHP
jgi:hypothetical protein